MVQTLFAAPSEDIRTLLTPGEAFFWRLSKDNASQLRHIISVLKLIGKIDIGLFISALKTVVADNESLRSVYQNTIEKDGTQGVRREIKRFMPFEIQHQDIRFLDDLRKTAEIDQIKSEEKKRIFSLECGPLFHFRLVELDQEYTLFFITIHHIVFDGWSLNLLLREISENYNSPIKKEKSSLVKTHQLTDFIHWYRREISRPIAVEKSLRYWTEQLHNLPPLRTFSDDNPPSGTSLDYNSLRVDFCFEIASRYSYFQREYKLLQFTLPLATFALLLFRYASINTLSILNFISLRFDRRFDKTMGAFIAVVFARITAKKNTTALDFLLDVQRTVLNASRNSLVPLHTILDHVSTVNAAYKDYFTNESTPKIMFNFLNSNNSIPNISQIFEDLKCEYVRDTGGRPTPYQVFLSVASTPMEIRGRLECWESHYSLVLVEQMVRHYGALLKQIVDSPLSLISTLNI